MILTPIKTEDIPLTISSDGVALKGLALTDSRSITEVNSVAAQSIAVLALRKLKGLIVDTEKSRGDVKAPVLEIGRKIDSLAKEFSADLLDEFERLTALVKIFTDDQAHRKAEAEAARLAEIARIEAEKQRLIREEAIREYKRKQESEIAAALEIRKRNEELTRIRIAKEKAEQEAVEIERKAAEREAALIAAQAAQKAPSIVARVAATVDRANQRAEEVAQNIRALDSLAAGVATAPIPEAQLTPAQIIEDWAAREARDRVEDQERRAQAEGRKAAQQVAAKPAGMSARKIRRWQVVDIHQLYRSNDTLVRMEPNAAAINCAINLTAALPAIPGLRIWEDTDVNVRR